MPVNDSVGFSQSFLGQVLNDSNVSVLNLSAISICEFNESGSAVNSPNVSGNRSSRNINNKINYSEVDATEDMVDSDDDKDYTPDPEPKSKRPLVQENVVAETPPLKRRPGRPKGSKNKNNPKKYLKGKGLKSPNPKQPKT